MRSQSTGRHSIPEPGCCRQRNRPSRGTGANPEPRRSPWSIPSNLFRPHPASSTCLACGSSPGRAAGGTVCVPVEAGPSASRDLAHGAGGRWLCRAAQRRRRPRPIAAVRSGLCARQASYEKKTEVMIPHLSLQQCSRNDRTRNFRPQRCARGILKVCRTDSAQLAWRRSPVDAPFTMIAWCALHFSLVLGSILMTFSTA